MCDFTLGTADNHTLTVAVKIHPPRIANVCTNFMTATRQLSFCLTNIYTHKAIFKHGQT